MKKIVQRSPNVGLTVRLRREASCSGSTVVAAPDPDPEPTGCSVTSIAWATIPTITGAFSASAANMWPSQGRSTHWVLAPHDSANNPTWLSTVVAIPLGAGVDGVRWEWAWNRTPGFPHSITATAPILVVSIPAAPYNSDTIGSLTTLTVSAFCGDSIVGALTLFVYFPTT